MTFKCEVCGRGFDTERGLTAHKNVVDHEQLEKKNQIRMLMDSPHASQHVYVLQIERPIDGELFYYVGLSNAVVDRIIAHLKASQPISIPTRSGGLTRQDYDVVGLERIEPFEDRSTARNAERKIMLETAIEKDTTKVIGGK